MFIVNCVTGQSWSLASKDWDSDLPAGDILGLRFIVSPPCCVRLSTCGQVDYSAARPEITGLEMGGVSMCKEQERG